MRADAMAQNLTKKVLAAIEREIDDGAGFQDACRLAGVHPKTGQRWRRVGALDVEAGKTTTPRARVYLAAEKAEAARKTGARKAVAESIADPTGERPDLKLKAATWYLEKTEPEEFGARVEIRVRGELEKILDAIRDHPLMPTTSYVDFLRTIADIQGVDLEALDGGDAIDAEDSEGLH